MPLILNTYLIWEYILQGWTPYAPFVKLFTLCTTYPVLYMYLFESNIVLYYNNTVAQAEGHQRNAACYDRLGCFSIDPPFNNTDVLPMNPSFINTQFYLFTNFHQRTPTTISEDDLNSSHGTNFRPELDTVIIIHGFLQNGRVDWMVHMAMEMLKQVRLQYKMKLLLPLENSFMFILKKPSMNSPRASLILFLPVKKKKSTLGLIYIKSFAC